MALIRISFEEDSTNSTTGNGKFLLRLDDTDTKRSSLKFAEKIKEDLRWVGLHWDQELCQSNHLDRYENAKKELIKSYAIYNNIDPETLKC